MPLLIICRTLGPVEVLVDGSLAPAELLWRKNLALLLYLARSPRRSRARDHLMALLWEDKPEQAARHSLNEAVRVLRRAIGESTIDTDARQVRLASGVLRLDVEDLEHHAEARAWCAASALVCGEFLEGFGIPGASGFEDWLTGERALWRARSVEVLTRCAEEHLRLGLGREAVATARQAAKLDPRSDQAARAAIRSLSLAGERAMALEHFEMFASRLRTDLGVEPEAETAALADRVRRERAAPAISRGGSAPEPRLPLIGRGRELGACLDVTEKARRDRRPVGVVLTGDAGTGKTRLLEELMTRLRLDGAVVAVARAVESDRDQPWSGLRALARSGLLEARGLAAAPTAAIAAFATELPEWADRFEGARHVTPWPPGRALGEVLRSAAEEQPVYLAVDDADHLDRDSLLALEAALRDAPDVPLGVLLTTSSHPPEGVDRLRTKLGREVTGVSIGLGPLGMGDLRDLARRVLPEFDEVEIDRVARRVGTDSAGIPLLAVELLRAVALGMDLGTVSGAWPEPFRTLDHTLPGDLPTAVVAAVRVGSGRLEPRVRQVLAAAAVLPDRFTPEALAHAADLPVEAVLQALDVLEWQRWIVSEPRGYGFTARIVREIVAREMLTTGQRRRILERVQRMS